MVLSIIFDAKSVTAADKIWVHGFKICLKNIVIGTSVIIRFTSETRKWYLYQYPRSLDTFWQALYHPQWHFMDIKKDL